MSGGKARTVVTEWRSRNQLKRRVEVSGCGRKTALREQRKTKLAKLEPVAKAVNNACSPRDIDQIRRPDRVAVTGVWTFSPRNQC
jgi:hypothetical protein